jgi:hypothetical protein
VGKEQEVQIDEMEEFAAEGHGEVQVHEIEEEGHREMQEERQMVSPSSEEEDYYKESFIRMIIIRLRIEPHGKIHLRDWLFQNEQLHL